MENALGTFIDDEVGRAETDFVAMRERAGAILTVSSLLVTALATAFAVASASDGPFALPVCAKLAITGIVVAFAAACLCVLVIFAPSDVDQPQVDDLRALVDDENEWAGPDWDREVSTALLNYLASLRSANERLAKWLTRAVACQAAGVIGSAILVAAIGFSL